MTISSIDGVGRASKKSGECYDTRVRLIPNICFLLGSCKRVPIFDDRGTLTGRSSSPIVTFPRYEASCHSYMAIASWPWDVASNVTATSPDSELAVADMIMTSTDC